MTKSKPGEWHLRLTVAASVIAVLILIIVAEVVCGLFFLFLSKHFYRPAYALHTNVLAWRTEHEDWGAWHKINSHVRHQSACFDVVYTSNSIGARDIDHARSSLKRRTVFLGDSFIEGFGVADTDRLSSRFEQATGIESINLAAAGDLGPLQYWLIYEQLANQFEHTDVVIGFVPINDFTDNDPTFKYWVNNTSRYRPYYRKVADGYEIFHKGTKVVGGALPDGWSRTPISESTLKYRHYTWMWGIYLALKGRLPARNIDIAWNVSRIGYFETSRDRIEASYYFLKKIIESASDKRVWILVMPTYAEALMLRDTPSPWITKFKSHFESRHVTVIDLGSVFSRLPKEVLRENYLSCDGHLSVHGNALAATQLIEAVKKTRVEFE